MTISRRAVVRGSDLRKLYQQGSPECARKGSSQLTQDQASMAGEEGLQLLVVLIFSC